MKGLLAWVCASITGVILQFGIFIVAYQTLTFPFLNEEQRAENAPLIFFYVLPTIFLATIFSMFVFHFFSRKQNQS